MAGGNPNQRWFPEMIEVLRTQWHPGLTWEELVLLRDQLDGELKRIRRDKGISCLPVRDIDRTKPCPKCGRIGQPTEPRISVRAMILALKRFEVADVLAVRSLERGWAKQRAEHGLDLYGSVEATHL